MSNENYTKKFRLTGRSDDRAAGCGWQARGFVTSKELIAAVSISLRFELVRVFVHLIVHLNHIAASSKNANHEIMGALFRDMFISVQLLEIRGS